MCGSRRPRLQSEAPRRSLTEHGPAVHSGDAGRPLQGHRASAHGAARTTALPCARRDWRGPHGGRVAGARAGVGTGPAVWARRRCVRLANERTNERSRAQIAAPAAAFLLFAALQSASYAVRRQDMLAGGAGGAADGRLGGEEEQSLDLDDCGAELCAFVLPDKPGGSPRPPPAARGSLALTARPGRRRYPRGARARVQRADGRRRTLPGHRPHIRYVRGRAGRGLPGLRLVRGGHRRLWPAGQAASGNGGGRRGPAGARAVRPAAHGAAHRLRGDPPQQQRRHFRGERGVRGMRACARAARRDGPHARSWAR
jgi:hypothetical protein